MICSFLYHYYQHTRELISAQNKYVTQVQQQRPQSPTVTLTGMHANTRYMNSHACKYKVHKLMRVNTRYINAHACKYKVHKLHQRYILCAMIMHKHSGPHCFRLLPLLRSTKLSVTGARHNHVEISIPLFDKKFHALFVPCWKFVCSIFSSLNNGMAASVWVFYEDKDAAVYKCT